MINRLFTQFSDWCADILGKPLAFIVSLLLVILWGVSGPLFHYSNTWQLVINTATTVITFLMLFVLQHTQNKDTRALHLKLDELIRSHEKADDQLMEIEKDVDGIK
jgi:low affinity Fe/Cu permease